MKRIVLVALACSAICSVASAVIAAHFIEARADARFDDFVIKTTTYLDGQIKAEDWRVDDLRTRIEHLEDRHR